jgi:hypothetical protein
MMKRYVIDIEHFDPTGNFPGKITIAAIDKADALQKFKATDASWRATRTDFEFDFESVREWNPWSDAPV